MSDKKKGPDLPLPDALAGNFQDAARWFSQLWVNSADAATGNRGPGAAIPSMLLPTLDVKELEKRIADMRSVESWLELNLGLLRTTIQGLEMQRQTLQSWQDFQSGSSSAKPRPGTPKPASGPEDAAPGFQPQAWWDALNAQFGQMAAQASAAAQQMNNAAQSAKTPSGRTTTTKGKTG